VFLEKSFKILWFSAFEGLNNLDVSVSEKGKYRVYASFSVGGNVIESSWSFEVI
jgi:hypothetical protein